MRAIPSGVAQAVVLGVAASIGCGEVKAQSWSAASSSLAAPPAPVTGGQTAPAAFPLFSPVQAMGANSSGLGGVGGQSNIFNNPYAAPMLYGGMYGMSANQSSSSAASTQDGLSVSPMGLSSNQMGMMMLASTPQRTGIGSGQLSGVRPGAGAANGVAAQKNAAKGRGSAPQTGGLAARYFNRTVNISRSPQSYFNRQTRYFPESGR
jgi:hypothetical protein